MGDMPSKRAPRMPGTRRSRQRPASAGSLPPVPRNWTTVKDAADRAGVHPATVYRWCEDNLVVCERLSRGWRVRLASSGFPLFRRAEAAESAAAA